MQDEKNPVLDGADIFSDWDKLVTDQSSTPKSETTELSLDALMTDGGDAHWLEMFRNTNLFGMDLVALKLIPNYVHDFKMEQAQLKTQTQVFLIDLVNAHSNELRIAGLSEDQIEHLAKGDLPINWTVHLKYPVAYGGVITANNLVLMPHQPFHEELHHFLNRQIVTDAGFITHSILYVPAPKGVVYVPFSSNDMPDKVIHFETNGGSK